MSTYQSPAGIAHDHAAEDRLHDLGVQLDSNPDGDLLAHYEDPVSGVSIHAYAPRTADVGVLHEALAATCQQAVLELEYRQATRGGQQ
jgi:hypothetical protein